MNVETGAIYHGKVEIEAARQRGEPVVRVSRKVALMMQRQQRLEKRALLARTLARQGNKKRVQRAKRRRAIQVASRHANRG